MVELIEKLLLFFLNPVIIVYNVQGILDSIITKQSSCPPGAYSLGKDRQAMGPLPAFVSEVLLEHSHTHSLKDCLWLLWGTTAELSSCNRDCMAPMPQTFAIWPFVGKAWQPWSGRRIL